MTRKDYIPVYWPNSKTDNEAWERAKRELGPSASVHAIVGRAQELKRRAQMEEEPDAERDRR
jgi:hypothetical protein